MDKRKTRYVVSYIALLILVAVMLLLNLYIGSVDASISDIMTILGAHDTESVMGAIVWSIRLPRLIAAAFLGGALAVSGFLLQNFFANPIASPFVLGISSGAKLVVALVMIFGLQTGIAMNSGYMIVAAFAGSLLAMGFVLLISSKVNKMSILIICGVMIGYICSAITDFLVTFADDSNIVNLHNWSLGSFSGISWENVLVIVIVVTLGMVWSFLLSKPMAAYQMGEVYARNMGVNVKWFRAQLILLSSLLSAAVTAFAGPISFVGIAVPHLVRSSMKTERPLYVLPACFLGGAAFCLFCDILARTLFAPTELSISSVTAVFGAPIVIYMMVHRQKGGAR